MSAENGCVNSRLPSSAQEAQGFSTWRGDRAEGDYVGVRWGSMNGDPSEKIIDGRYESWEQDVPHRWGSRDGNVGEHLAELHKHNGHKCGAVTVAAVDGRAGRDGEGLAEQAASGDVIAGEHGSIVAWGSSAQEMATLAGNNRGSGEKKAGEQAARVVPLLSGQLAPLLQPFDGVEPPSVSAVSGGEGTEEQSRQWLKAVLPEATHGWWDVYLRGKGFALKFCWRDRGLQKLTFPRITLEQLRILKGCDADGVAETLRAQISDHLQGLLRDPEKRGKALAAAEKLGIDLAVHTTNTLVSKGL